MKNKRSILLSILASAALMVWIGLRAFQSPIPLSKVELIKSGMTSAQVREILGPPTVTYPGTVYESKGSNDVVGGQWTYERTLAFGYINVLFETNGVVDYAHYEQF